MPTQDEPVYSWATPDFAQPLDPAEREVIDAAMEIFEWLLRGPVALIVARPEFGGYSFMEPRHRDVDFVRVKHLLESIIDYMGGEDL